MNAGDVLAIMLRSSAPQSFGYSWRTGNQGFNPYAFGSPTGYQPQLSLMLPHPETDAHFRTFVLNAVEVLVAASVNAGKL